LGFRTVGWVIFWEIPYGLKESQFAPLALLFYLSKTGQFEDRAGRLKPLLGEAFSRFAGRKCLQHGEVEHLNAILKGKIKYNADVYWLSAV
jgi:hypothetical protein